ncbi:MAG: hypothetical protein KAQ87_04415 [Candidatus Pacebacteria bacterium]|nr:hypothetical protein [Candidatus Paceibacterota bacterium]
MKKESLSAVFVKTLLAVLLFAGIGTIIIGGGYIIWEYGKNKAENKIAEPVNQETYYQKLAEDCEKFKKSKFVTDYDCCLQSVEIMQKGNFKLASESICPDGFQINSLWCGGAYSWCEPIKKADCAKEGETIGAYSMPEICCAGLKEIGGWHGGYDGDCSLPAPPSGLSICSNCGDGNCNIDTGENKCNCPEDCSDEIDTTDWQTYRNEEFGFEVKYPGHFGVSEKDNVISLINYYDSSQKIKILKHSGPSLETMDMKSVGTHKVLVDEYVSNIELFQGRFDNNKDKYYLRVFIFEKDVYYHAETDKDKLEELSSIFNQILSTFKFIEK